MGEKERRTRGGSSFVLRRVGQALWRKFPLRKKETFSLLFFFIPQIYGSPQSYSHFLFSFISSSLDMIVRIFCLGSEAALQEIETEE